MTFGSCPIAPAAEERRLCPLESLAMALCVIGFFAHIVFAEPTLNMVGFPYGDEGASLLAKIHPGNFFIFGAFALFIAACGNPIGRLLRIAREQAPFMILLLFYLVVMLYWLARGPKGVGVILDVHMTMPICVIMFAYATRGWLRLIVGGFAAFAIANSAVGVIESLTRGRLFPFDESWEVLHQNYFRASAFMGHPLVNAAFVASSIFVVLALPLRPVLKTASFAVMLASLVAFGGRSSFGFCLIGLVVLGVAQTWHFFTGGGLSVRRLMAGSIAVITIPLLCAGLLYLALNSSMGERLLAYSTLNDESAAVRIDSWRAFELIEPEELFIGIGNDRVIEVGNMLGVASPTSDIENPWILICLFFGLPLFTIWLAILGVCLRRVADGASLPLVLAMIEYFAVASMSNSFGRKDPIFMLIPAIVLCAKRLADSRKIN